MLRRAVLAALPAALLALALAPPARAADPPRRVVMVFDASGSMWAQIGGEARIVIARRALAQVLGTLPAGTEVGLVAYGHRRDGDCQDIEVLVPIGPRVPGAIEGKLQAIQPKGKTPIGGSVREAFRLVREAGGPATVIVLSDGLDTCGTDPCVLVREARASGADFVLHVVGLGIEEADLSSLECMAQAGSGLFFDARDAAGLSAALAGAVAPPEAGGEELKVGATADGKLVDATAKVFERGGKREVAVGRTYAQPATNPRTLRLPVGTYDVMVTAVAIAGASQRFEDVKVEAGKPASVTADFSTGEILVRVRRNGALSDATVEVVAAGAAKPVAQGRTYTQAASNPKRFRVPAGSYEVVVRSVEIAGKPERRLAATVVPGKPAELSVDFESATLAVGARNGAALVDATVVVKAAGKEVDRCRTYDKATSNPCRFVLPPGAYAVEVAAVKLEGAPRRQLAATLGAGAEAALTADFGAKQP